MTSPRLVALAVAAALALPVSFPSAPAMAAVVTAPAEGVPAQVRLEVDVSGLSGYEGFDPAIYDDMSRQALREGLSARGVEASQGAADSLKVALSWRDFDASIYEIIVTATPAGGEAQTLEAALCEHCTDDELVVMLEGQLEAGLRVLAEAEAVEDDGGTGGDDGDVVVDGDTGTGDETGEDDEGRERKGLSPLAGAGIGVAVVGVGGIVGGAVLFARDESLAYPSDVAIEHIRTTYRPPATGLLVGGGVLLATGVALIIVGQLRQGKKDSAAAESRAPSRRFTWSPSLSPHHAGLHLRGRF